jgi:hypothetical protein
MTRDHQFSAAPATRPEMLAGDRRAFLRALVRYPAVAGMAVLGGWLAFRRVDPGAVEPCVKQRVCRGCQLFSGCERPQALATREQI